MSLTPEEQATYEWQMWVEEFGEAGQVKLKEAVLQGPTSLNLAKATAKDLLAGFC